MVREIWKIWYDLRDEEKSEYLPCLHGEHLPGMLKRSGYLWAAHVENVHDEEREKRLHRNLTHTEDPAVPAGKKVGFRLIRRIVFQILRVWRWAF